MDGWLDAVWNTVAATNGTYHLAPLVELSNGESFTGAVTTVTVANDIRFTDDFFVAGSLLHIEAQTIHTNGTWHLDVYGDDEWIGQVAGSVNAQGYCVYPGIAGNGFSLPLTYSDGTAFPYSSYATVMTTTPLIAQTASPTTATNKIRVEKPWWGATKWVIAYMPIYTTGTQSGYWLDAMMAGAVGTVQGIYGDESVVNSTYAVTPQPFKLRNGYFQDWALLQDDLIWGRVGQPVVRNLFYFGHGSGEQIGAGEDPNLKLTRQDFLTMFRNGKDPLTQTNRHPFRFVFLDGCETAKGDLCLDFGIPKKEMVAADFASDRGLRPRAFVGWKDKKLIGVAGALNQTHKQFVDNFFALWPTTPSGEDLPYGVKQALEKAAKNENDEPYTQMGTDVTAYGATDLFFNDDGFIP
jgi:hypothetical protein